VYRTGHYGAALLVWAPVGLAALLAGFPEAALLGGAGTLALTRLPDYDLRVPFLTHRGITHTVWFALAVGGALGAAGWFGLGDPELAAFAAAVGLLAVGAHLLADVITPAGIAPFYPLSRREYTLSLATADSRLANGLLLAAGAFCTAAAALVGGRLVGLP
jgi:inner membrane protein